MKTNRFFAAIAAVAALVACNKEETKVTYEVSASPASLTFEADGGTLKVAISTNAKDYSVAGAPEWLAVEQNGNELSLTAQANTVNQARNASLEVKAMDASCTIAVSQKAGSPFGGFTTCSEAMFEYSGNMLYQFIKPSEEDYGGQGYIIMEDEDGNSVAIWVYTELFASEEEVELTAGTYTKGKDVFPMLVGKKMTFCPGSVVAFDEEESDIMGSFVAVAAEESIYPIVDGTVEVSNENGVYTIKADVKDDKGNSYKYVYMGELEIDCEGAGYPGTGNHIDVAATAFAADCFYLGTMGDVSVCKLVMYSGDEEAGKEEAVTTNFEFFIPACEFSEDMDLSGNYFFSEEGEVAPGVLVPGALVELFPGFSIPSGTFIVYAFGDYLIADMFASLILEKQGDGSYNISSSMMSSEGDMVMFLDKNFTLGIYNEEYDID